MKKYFILLAVLLTGLCTQAANWQPVETYAPNTSVYIDEDSVRVTDNNEYLYAIRYKVGDAEEKVAYIKSDSKTGYIGIIYSTDYDEANYKPKAVFANPHVFMKPINNDSFLRNVHNYAIAVVNGTRIAGSKNAVYTSSKPALRNEVNVSYNGSKNSRDVLTPAQLEEYVVKTCKILEENWTPPASGRGTRAIIVLTIGADGSLLNYNFTETSGDNITDRSILSAVEKTVPYPKFPEIAKGAYSLDFQFVFEHDLLKKSVVY